MRTRLRGGEGSCCSSFPTRAPSPLVRERERERDSHHLIARGACERERGEIHYSRSSLEELRHPARAATHTELRFVVVRLRDRERGHG